MFMCENGKWLSSGLEEKWSHRVKKKKKRKKQGERGGEQEKKQKLPVLFPLGFVCVFDIKLLAILGLS